MKIARITAVTALVVTIGLVSLSRIHSQDTNTDTNTPPSSEQNWRGMTPEERFNRLSEELGLTADQKPKVQAVFDEMRGKIQTAIEDARTNADAQLQTILTPEQYQKLQDITTERQEQFHHHWGEGSTNSSSTNESSGQ